MCFGKAGCISIIISNKVEIGDRETNGDPYTVIQEKDNEDCISQNLSDCKWSKPKSTR